jgi:UDP-N-acetylglucosamine:LPS N-acetylglucosamine transferase
MEIKKGVKEAVEFVEKKTGIDLPDEKIEKTVSKVATKDNLEKAKEMVSKVATKENIEKVKDKVEDIVEKIKK